MLVAIVVTVLISAAVQASWAGPVKISSAVIFGLGAFAAVWLIFGRTQANAADSSDVLEKFADDRIIRLKGWGDLPERTKIFLGKDALVVLYQTGGHFSHLILFRRGENLFQLHLSPLEDGRRYDVLMTNGQIVGLAWGPNLDVWLGYVLLGITLTEAEADSGFDLDVVTLIEKAIKHL